MNTAASNKSVVVCRECSDEYGPFVMPFRFNVERDAWVRVHVRSTGHEVRIAEGWPGESEAWALTFGDPELAALARQAESEDA